MRRLWPYSPLRVEFRAIPICFNRESGNWPGTGYRSEEPGTGDNSQKVSVASSWL